MLDELVEMPNYDLSNCKIDPEGPGIGVHMFERVRPLTHYVGIDDTDGTRTVNGLVMEGADDRLRQIQWVRIQSCGTIHATGLPVQATTAQALADASEPFDVEVASCTSVMKEWAVKIQALLRANVVRADPVLPPRHIRRQAGRGQGLRMDTPVRIVRWCKFAPQSDSGDGPGEVRDKHWWVRGHVRAQWYAKKAVHRAIYIGPHVKGNPSAPLHRIPVVHKVVRGP